MDEGARLRAPTKVDVHRMLDMSGGYTSRYGEQMMSMRTTRF